MTADRAARAVLVLAIVVALEPGKLADLVALSADPLEDIRHTREIAHVVKHGVADDGDDLARVWPDPGPAGRIYFARDDEDGSR